MYIMETITEDTLRNSKNTLEEISSQLVQRSKFYREENTRMEAVLSKLSLLNNELKFFNSTGNVVEALADIAQNNDTNSINPTAILMSKADKVRKHSNYSAKLKMCIKLYINLNDQLSKNIKSVKSELEQSKEKLNGILSMSHNELKQLEEKLKRYENELGKLENKYPWLRNSELNLPDISKEIDILRTLRSDRDKLLKELEIYQGLKPDLKEATQQLEAVRLENIELSNKLVSSQK